jgi:excisionase family DNA binding protein
MSGWVTIAGAAKHASVSKRTVSRWLKDGLKHARLHSNSVRIKLDDLYEWMERFCQHHVDIDEQVAKAMVKARKKLAEMRA